MRPPLFLVLALVLAGSAGVVACGDEITDADALVSAEADAILRAAGTLPTLPALLDGAAEPQGVGSRAALDQARALWDEAPGRPARQRRRQAARLAAPYLAAGVESQVWDDARRRMVDWLDAGDAMLQHLSLADTDAHLRTARGYIGEADAASATETRVRFLLLAAATLVETTPRAVAEDLLTAATAALADSREARSMAEAEGAGEPERIRRARRLVHWAGQAMQEEDYLVAAQRAYYATQLVEGR